MKLYLSPGACSLSVHIALREGGIPHETEQVDLASKTTASGDDYTRINPKGYVPALLLDDGELLTEVPALLDYIAEMRPGAELAPPAGTIGRFRFREWLAFLSSELHKTFSPLFLKAVPDSYKAIARGNLSRRFDFIEGHLSRNDYLLGTRYSAADGFAFTLLRWTPLVGIDPGPWPGIRDYLVRIGKRPAVAAALQAEGLGQSG